MEPKKYNKSNEGFSSWVFVIIIILCALVLFNGCKTITEYQKEYVYKTDTLYQKVLQKDSVYVSDSIIIKMKGDTMYLDRWHTKYVEKLLHDTIYKSKTDSVYIDVLKEKDITWKERAGMFLSDVMSFILLCVGIFALYKLARWIMKLKTGI